jgi:hypothetical protein
VTEAHACNPGYSGGRDQEDPGLKPALANSSQDLISGKKKQNPKPLQKKGWWSSSRSTGPSTAKKKKKKYDL